MSGAEHVLLATVFYQRQEDGSRKRYLTGDVVTGLSEEKVARLLKAGAIGTAADLVAEPEPVPLPDPADGSKPETDDNKPKLVAWLLANTVKDDGSDYTETELNRLNKAALWDLINSVED